MKLDRNINQNGMGKYALLNLRRLEGTKGEISAAVSRALGVQALQFGDNSETDFFVIKLKDKFAARALQAYKEAVIDEADTVRGCDPDKWKDLMEYATEIDALVMDAMNHPNQKIPN